MATTITTLRPEFRALVETFLARLDAQGIRYVVTDTTRTAEEQAAAFARGASKCDGYKVLSKHQLGLAIDVVPQDELGRPTWNYRRYPTAYKRIAAVARELGLECGIDWMPSPYEDVGLGWDPPHYEMRRPA